MKEYNRNIAVGVTAIIALALLAGMILVFTGLPAMFRGGYMIHVLADTTYDAHVGDPVHLSGMRVGSVRDIRFTDPSNPAGGVTFVVGIEKDIRLPSTAVARFFTRGLVGSAYIELDVPKPRPQETESYLPIDGSAVIKSVHMGSEMLPKELTDAIASFGKLADNLNELLAPAETAPATAPEARTQPEELSTAGGLKSTVVKLNTTLDAIRAVIGDEQNRRNFKSSLENLAQASASAGEAMESVKKFAADASRLSATSEKRVDELAGRLVQTADRVSDLMASINRTVEKMESGEGTAGKLLNDPRLYNDLLEAVRQMTRLMQEMQEMVKTWQTTGVKIKPG